jgi:hypothetical protein
MLCLTDGAPPMTGEQPREREARHDYTHAPAKSWADLICAQHTPSTSADRWELTHHGMS